MITLISNLDEAIVKTLQLIPNGISHGSLLSWRAHVDSLAAPACIIDADKIMTYANQAMLDFLKLKDTKKYDINDLFDCPDAIFTKRTNLLMTKKGATYRVEGAPLHNRKSRQNDAAMIAIADITKILNAQMQNYVDDMGSWFAGIADEALFTLISGKIMYANQSALKLLGVYKSANSVFRQSIFHYFSAESYNFLSQYVVYPRQHGQEDNYKEPLRHELIRKDGSKAIIEVCSILHRAYDIVDLPVTYVCLKDVTLEIEHADEMRQMQQQLADANKMASLGVVASAVAHEINNPNASIRMSAEIIRKLFNDTLTCYLDKLQEVGVSQIGKVPLSRVKQAFEPSLARIDEACKQINEIVQYMRHFAKNDAKNDGGDSAQKFPVDTKELLERTWNFLQLHIKRKTFKHKFFVEPDIPRITCNPTRIQQMVANLITNAVEALPSPDKGISVGARFNSITNCVEIIVDDEGGGIPQEMLEKIRQKSALFATSKPDGVGLGLHIAQEIASQHGATIHFNSRPGEGTTVTVSIPATSHGVKENSDETDHK